MSFTDTEKHWLWGCAAATASSRSDVNVAMPHLRGKWSPTNAILRTLEVCCMRYPFAQRPRSRVPRPRREIQWVSQVLRLPVIIQSSGPPSLELQRLQEFDLLRG